MSISVLSKLALQGIWNRRTIYFPYLLAVILVMALEYILISLLNNEYVQTRHETLVILIAIGVFFATLLSGIFILYANNFILKQRRQEFALYTVLGLETKHIRLLIFIEQFIMWLFTSLLAIGIGYTIGNVMFISLNRLMLDTGASLMDYPFDFMAALITFLIMGLIFVGLFVVNSWRMTRVKPAELMSQSNAGESEPKSRWFILLIGVITLVAGYYIALTTEGVLNSLMNIFIAVFLVIIATYCLFIALSIIVLKFLKANKKLYYRPNNFLSISGMLYRMKANAVSLASITILCTGIVLTLGTTLTLYLGMDYQVESVMPRDYSVEYLNHHIDSQADEPEVVEEHLNQTMNYIQQLANVEDLAYSRTLFLPTYYEENRFMMLPSPDQAPQMNINQISYLMVITQDDFEALHQQNVNLSQNEVLLATLDDDFEQYSSVELAGQTYDFELIDRSYIPTNFVGNIFYIVVPDMVTMLAMQETYLSQSLPGSSPEPIPITYEAQFNVSGDSSLLNDSIDSITSDDTLLRITSKSEVERDLYSVNGGFLFLGIIIGLVLLIGTVLLLYFKQISEGYDDRDNYRIMKQVGLPNDLIKKTIRNQILWVFALPILVAIIHSLAASPIMFELLGLFGLRDFNLFAVGYGSILAIFLVVYFILYIITSRIYYQIIKEYNM